MKQENFIVIDDNCSLDNFLIEINDYDGGSYSANWSSSLESALILKNKLETEAKGRKYKVVKYIQIVEEV